MAGKEKEANFEIIRLRARYSALTGRLKEPGLILQGTITERSITPLGDKKELTDLITSGRVKYAPGP